MTQAKIQIMSIHVNIILFSISTIDTFSLLLPIFQ